MSFDIFLGNSVPYRAKVYDASKFKNDLETPFSELFLPGTVLKERYDQYGRLLVDVKFDHRPGRISHGHFKDGIEIIE